MTINPILEHIFRFCQCRTFLLDSRMEKNNICSGIKDFDNAIVFILHQKGRGKISTAFLQCFCKDPSLLRAFANRPSTVWLSVGYPRLTGHRRCPRPAVDILDCVGVSCLTCIPDCADRRPEGIFRCIGRGSAHLALVPTPPSLYLPLHTW